MKKLLLRIYAQKAAPGLHKAKTEDLKKKLFLHLQPKRGLYTKGVIHEGDTPEALKYTTGCSLRIGYTLDGTSDTRRRNTGDLLPWSV